MLGKKNKNYSLYLAGVINEEEYIVHELNEEREVIEKIAFLFEESVAKNSNKWLRLIEQDESVTPEEKKEAIGVIGWFKNRINSIKQSVSEYFKKGEDQINNKVNKVLEEAYDWEADNKREAEFIKRMARMDAKAYVPSFWEKALMLDRDPQIAKNDYTSSRTEPTFLDKVLMTDRDPRLGESVIGAIGSFVNMAVFKLIKFILIDVLSVAIRTVLNTMRQMFTTEGKGIKFMINLMIAVIIPLGVIYGSGGSELLIATGLFYIVQVLKSIYEQVSGQPLLRPEA
jgi:hypothetical protein